MIKFYGLAKLLNLVNNLFARVPVCFESFSVVLEEYPSVSSLKYFPVALFHHPSRHFSSSFIPFIRATIELQVRNCLYWEARAN